MMKVVIIEDEPLSAKRLEGMLKKYDSSIEVLAELPSVSSAVTWFKENGDPDLALMDIHLEDGQSFKIFETINLQVPVIFTTAYDEYTIRTFKVNSIDYLMKPLNYEELSAALDKFKRLHAAGTEEREPARKSGLLAAAPPLEVADALLAQGVADLGEAWRQVPLGGPGVPAGRGHVLR